MRILVTGPAAAFDENDEEITSAEQLARLDGLEYTDEVISKYFDESLDEIGITGGGLRLVFDKSLGRLQVVSEFLSPRKLKPKELKLLVEETTGQWSDGIGEGDVFDLDGVYLDFYPTGDDDDEPLPEVRVEQIDDGSAVRKPRKSPLLNLAAKGNVEKLKKKLDEGEDINARDKYGHTPLHLAIMENQTDAALLLIERGADIEAFDDAGFCPLTTAAIRGNLEVGQALLDRGADVNRHQPGDKEDAGYAPLKMACNRNEFAFARLLIERGADVNLADHSGYTPLLMLDPEGLDENEIEQMAALAKLLIDRGADPNARNFVKRGMKGALRERLGL